MPASKSSGRAWAEARLGEGARKSKILLTAASAGFLRTQLLHQKRFEPTGASYLLGSERTFSASDFARSEAVLSANAAANLALRARLRRPPGGTFRIEFLLQPPSPKARQNLILAPGPPDPLKDVASFGNDTPVGDRSPGAIGASGHAESVGSVPI